MFPVSSLVHFLLSILKYRKEGDNGDYNVGLSANEYGQLLRIWPDLPKTIVAGDRILARPLYCTTKLYHKAKGMDISPLSLLTPADDLEQHVLIHVRGHYMYVWSGDEPHRFVTELNLLYLKSLPTLLDSNQLRLVLDCKHVDSPWVYVSTNLTHASRELDLVFPVGQDSLRKLILEYVTTEVWPDVIASKYKASANSMVFSQPRTYIESSFSYNSSVTSQRKEEFVSLSQHAVVENCGVLQISNELSRHSMDNLLNGHNMNDSCSISSGLVENSAAIQNAVDNVVNGSSIVPAVGDARIEGANSAESVEEMSNDLVDFEARVNRTKELADEIYLSLDSGFEAVQDDQTPHNNSREGVSGRSLIAVLKLPTPIESPGDKNSIYQNAVADYVKKKKGSRLAGWGKYMMPLS